MKYNFEITGDIGYGYGSKEYVRMKLNECGTGALSIRVNSLGGSVDDALDIYSRLHDHGDVTVHFRGMNASAATILAMGAKHITIDSVGMLLIHNALAPVMEWSLMNADEIRKTIEDLRNKAENLDTISQVICSMYANRSGKSLDEIRSVMGKGGWLTAQQCLDLGIVDEIVEDANSAKAMIAARANYTELALAYNLPELPTPTVAQQTQTFIFNFENSMKKILNQVLALFAIASVGEDATEDQLNGAFEALAAEHKKQSDALAKATADLSAANETINTLKADHAKAIADEKAACQATIEQLNAKIAAMSGAPGAQTQEPVTDGNPQTPVGATIVDGKSAKELYDMVMGVE